MFDSDVNAEEFDNDIKIELLEDNVLRKNRLMV